MDPMDFSYQDEVQPSGQAKAKPPIKSCLKIPPLSDISNRQIAPSTGRSTKKRKVRFTLPQKTSPKKPTIDQQILTILQSYGDVTQAQADKIDNTDGTWQVFANFQRGFLPKAWFNYFGKLLKKKHYLGVFQASNLHDLQLPPNSLIVIECTDSNTNLAELFEQIQSGGSTSGAILFYGDVHLLLETAKTSFWKEMSTLHFIATEFDIKRWGSSNASSEATLISGEGIPLVVHELMFSPALGSPDPPIELQVPWMKYLHRGSVSNEDYQSLFLRLYILSVREQPIPADWTYGNASYIDIARACCFLVTSERQSAVRSEESASSTGSQHDIIISAESLPEQNQQQATASLAISGQPLSQIEQSTPPVTEESRHAPRRVYIVIPRRLAQRYVLDNPKCQSLSPNEQLAWVMMETVACRNLLTLKGSPPMTFGERFSFLAQSFVRDLPHNTAQHQPFPKVCGWYPRYTALQDIHNMPTIGRHDWPALMKDLLASPKYHNVGLIPCIASSSPDYMVAIDKDHVLCLQFKSGAQDLTFSKMMDELEKCPMMVPFKGGRLFKGQFKLTFVYAAMNHTKIKEEINAPQKLVQKLDCSYRLDHSFDCGIPANVEVIVLRKAGLIRLLGIEHYDYIHAFNVLTDKVAAELLNEFDCYESAPYSGGQNTANVVMMVHKLFPQWQSTLTAEELYSFIDQLVPHLSSRYELKQVVNPLLEDAIASAPVNPSPLVPLTGTVPIVQPAAPKAALARTFSQRDDENATQQVGKKPKSNNPSD